MEPSTTVHREIEIRYAYDIATDRYRAHFVLPEVRRKPVGFQRAVFASLSKTVEPGKHHVDGQSESEVLARARSLIDDYLDDK